jgi:hypothetical protein
MQLIPHATGERDQSLDPRRRSIKDVTALLDKHLTEPPSTEQP